ncbi:hypothetical protein CBS101457_006597 [Exobasidium rhododendri]|nr:hypothetical protein CBS101457_006597 [Exobasidium rhododendri]
MKEEVRSTDRRHADILTDLHSPSDGTSEEKGDKDLCAGLAAALHFDENGKHTQSKAGVLPREIFAADLEEKYLTPQARMDSHLLRSYQIHWDRSPGINQLLQTRPDDPPTKFILQRVGLDGQVKGLKEVPSRPTRSTVQIASLSSSSSSSKVKTGAVTSLTRNTASSAASSAANFVRGKIGQRMFVPGGLEEEILEESRNNDDGNDEDERDIDSIKRQVSNMEDEIEKGVGLLSVPPGFKRGFRKGGQPAENDDAGDDDVDDDDETFRGLHVSDASDGFKPLLKDDSSHTAVLPVVEEAYNLERATERNNLDADLDDLLPSQKPIQRDQAKQKSREPKRDWAHVVDINQKFTNFRELVPNPAHEYPFELDNFQKEAVYHLEQGDSVFVAAHTSAGKTVVAEYAISLAMKHMTRCIYTSPIKALSNQKFRDFTQTYGKDKIGILTGDIQINPEAPCLIMTTEILRSMLYRGADLIRDVEFVIFDEVHYVNDQERGVVWEEVIILCPQHISLILLSATVPNTKEFAEWVGRTKKRDIYVISTPKRPVPLEHYLYAGKEIHKVVDAKGQFLNSGVKDAGEAIKRRQEKEREANGQVAMPVRGGRGGATSNGRGGQRGQANGRGGPVLRGRGGGGNFSGGGQSGRGDKSLWINLVGMLRKKELLPVVVFVFSKKRCEEFASSMPNTNLNDARERSEVHIVIEKSLQRLKGTDKDLPQIIRMRDLLGRGIGIHHGGLLPIVKEMVEILFQRGLVKVLFATETFAMGVNMPARSVVFSGIRKHDGHTFRELLAGEYTQMSGRAGRRGLDATGMVIINAADELPETGALNKMLLGQPTKLQSQFRLTYNMILNLLRVEALKVEEMIKRSFSENASQRLLPDQEKKVKEVEKLLSNLPVMPDKQRSEGLDLYYDLCLSIRRANFDVLEMALHQQQASKSFGPGRVIIVHDKHFSRFCPAVIVKSIARDEFLVLAVVTEEQKSGKLNSKWDVIPPLWPPTLDGYPTEGLTYELTEISLSSIVRLTVHVIKVEQSMIMALRISAMRRTVEQLVPIISTMVQSQEYPEVDWSKIRRIDFQEAVKMREKYSERLSDYMKSWQKDPSTFTKEYDMTHHRKLLELEISRLKLSISDENLELLPDYRQRIEVLKKMRFIDPISENVLLKGRVACEINSVDELVSTELILDNFWNGFEPAEIVGLLSCLVFKEKADGEVELSGRLLEGYERIVATAEKISSIESSFQLNTQDYEVSLKTHMIPVAHAWAKGMPFAEICTMTDIAEGTIVRVITRLDESCKELRDAARVIGDADLWSKMESCMELIRRDVIFAGSLYF